MSPNLRGTSQSKGKGKRYFSWTVEMDRVMASCFIDQMNQGNKLDGICAWKPVAYTAVISDLQEQLNVSVSKAHIQARFKTWKKHYDILHPLLQSCNSRSAITWNYSVGTIEVHDENIWRDKLETNPKLGPYRKKIVVENWKDICLLFSEDGDNVEGAQTAFEANAEMEVEESINVEESFETNAQSMENEGEAMNALLAQQKSKSKASSSDSRGTKRKPRSSQALQALHKALDRIANSLGRYLNSETPKVTTQVVLDELHKVTLQEKQLLKGVDLLMNDEIKFNTFVGLPDDLKKPWLLMHIG